MITQMQNLTDAEHAILNQTWRGKKILSYLQANSPGAFGAFLSRGC